MSFDFKQFHVDDNRCAMKVGTDGVLLGAWAEAEVGPARVIDLGAGSGLVSLMLAQRFPQARIRAVECEAPAAADCRDNFARSPFADRLETVCGDALDQQPCHGGYDLVVSNPPFFAETLHSPDQARALARHAAGLSPFAVIDIAARLLGPDGSVALIVPAQYAAEVIYHAAVARLNERRRLDVSPREGAPAVRILLQFARRDGDVSRDILAIRDAGGRYSEAYRRLTGSFYLNM